MKIISKKENKKSKYKCVICGHRFEIEIDKKYVVKIQEGLINKTYYDAGFKDNLILETCKSNLTYNDIGIIFTKDSDFGIQFDNIFIARTRDELETIIREHCPDYIIMKLIEKVDTESKKIDLLSILDKDNNSNLRIVDFSNEQIEYDEEEDIFTFFVFANIDDQLQKIKITYNEYMDSIDYAEMLE